MSTPRDTQPNTHASLPTATSSSAAQRCVLVVDDDPLVTQWLAELLSTWGWRTLSASDGPSALRILRDAAQADDAPSVAIVDLTMPGMDGLELLRHLRERAPAVAPIVLTGYATIESAVAAMRLGAVDVLTKPAREPSLREALERALARHALAERVAGPRLGRDPRRRLAGIVGGDERMLRIFDMVDAVAAARTTLLMTGESGVGKSVIARAIHDAGPRRSGPFVEISCGSIPETLLESELFGHVKGAFTGAHADKIGRFRAADGGTLFLDEINSASAAMQLKLLRVLQERRFEPVGSTQTIEVDVRVIVASNQPLEALVASGQFRQDLFYRVNVVKIELPPLRERRGDIAALARHFLASHAEELGKQVVGFTPEAIAALERYTYPGNVRELENIVERAVVLCRTPTIGVEELPEHLFAPAAATEPRLTASVEENVWTPMTLERALREPERRIILSALRANNWNRQRTAEQLGINRTTLYKRMKALEIDGESTEAA